MAFSERKNSVSTLTSRLLPHLLKNNSKTPNIISKGYLYGLILLPPGLILLPPKPAPGRCISPAGEGGLKVKR